VPIATTGLWLVPQASNSQEDPAPGGTECRRELARDSPELRLELTCDDEPLVYCAECWQQEFGGEPA
jgi:hypothetical protein